MFIYIILKMLVKIFIPTIIILLGVCIFYIAVTRLDRMREQQERQRRVYEIANAQIRNQQKQKTEDKKKTEFDALPYEEKLEILTQKYLTISPLFDGFDNVPAPIQETTQEEPEWDEEEYNIGIKMNRLLKGYFGFEYNEFFEGFSPNEETEEENMIANGLI